MANNMSAGRWLLFLDRMTSLEDYFSDIQVSINCEFLVAQKQDATKDGCLKATVTEVFYAHRTRPLQTYRVGNWSSCDGFSWSTVPFDERRGDLHGAVIQSGIYSAVVAKDIRSCKEKTALKFCGQIEEIWHTLQEVLNFTSLYYVAEDKSYGSRRSDGTWNGVMNLTVSKRVEVGIGRFIFSEERMSAVHFLPPILITRMSVFIKEMDADESTWNYVLAPLSSGMWLAMLATMLMLALFLFATWYLGQKYGNRQGGKSYTLYNSWIEVMASFCQQGQNMTPRSGACRVVFVTSYFTAVTVLAAYSATLISFLTVSRTVLPFTDFKGLLDDGKYKLGVFPNSAQMYYLENSPDPILRGVLERLVKPDYENLPTNDTEGLRRICDKKNYAFLTSQFFVRQCYGDYQCNVVEIPDASFHASTSMIINKHSQYKRLFSQRLQQMRRNGILKAIVEKYLPFGVTKDGVKLPRSVSLQKTLPVFILLLSGVFISVVCLLIEMQVDRQRWHRRARPTDNYCAKV